MKIEDHYFKTLLEHHAMPIFKKAFQEFLSENQLALISLKANDDCLINTTEASKMLGGLDRHTIYDYIDQGLLSAQKKGKGFKFKKEDIQNFINNKNK